LVLHRTRRVRPGLPHHRRRTDGRRTRRRRGPGRRHREGVVPTQGRARIRPRPGGHPRRRRPRPRLGAVVPAGALRLTSRIRRHRCRRRPGRDRNGARRVTTQPSAQPARTPLADQPARDRVESDTAATLFVEAGAGTGKTYALVRRLGALLLTDRVPIEQIAAITLTEKAAAELRDRLRVFLVDARDQGDPHADAALTGLDTAAIGTLHSFALRLLSENPLEAGIPPRVTAQQDPAEHAAVEELWPDCAARLFGPGREDALGGSLARAVDDLLDGGVSTTAFREVVLALHRDWDRLPDDAGDTPDPGAVDLPPAPD